MMISICIPTYEMGGKGHTFLEHSFSLLNAQTFKNFDVVVSDHSTGEDIKSVCDKYRLFFPISYYKNPSSRGSSSANINYAMNKAQGDIIKILFQDDYLCDANALDLIHQKFEDNKVDWVVNGTVHTSDNTHFYNPIIPRYNSLIHLGNNTISSPSVLAMRNKDINYFDEKLIWLMDVEYYKRLYDKYGLPVVIDRILVVNRIWEGQVSHTKIDSELINQEEKYVKEKHS